MESRFKISGDQLLTDLIRAYKDARRHKRWKMYQLEFENDLEHNLITLRDEILQGRYHPGTSTCFIIHDPKMREVFAARFKDRIVHHLLYNYLYDMFVPDFLLDSYSCIKGRGTHFGIRRLSEMISHESRCYSRRCYVLKLDISGYFMHIDRTQLLRMCLDRLWKKALESVPEGELVWSDLYDFQLVEYLLETIVMHDPLKNCIRISGIESWEGLSPSKSLFCSEPGKGLPIGNLTSQLFSNIYLDGLDHFIEALVGPGRYGRYVDDFFIIGRNKAELRGYIPVVRGYLEDNLGLTLSERKTVISSVYQGVEFLGAYIKPFRSYPSSKSLRRLRAKLPHLKGTSPKHIACSVNSILGLLGKHRSHNLRRNLIRGQLNFTSAIGVYDPGLRKLKLNK